MLESEECRRALAVVRRASQRPHSVFPIRWEQGLYTRFPHLAQFRLATRLGAARAMLEARDGDMAGAVDWLGVCYRMTGHVLGEPTQVGQLMGYAMLALANRAARGILSEREVTPVQAQALGHIVGRLQIESCFEKAMVGERAVWLSVCQETLRDPRAIQDLFCCWQPAGAGSSRGWLLLVPYLKLEELNFLRYMNKTIERSRQPYREAAAHPQESQVPRKLGYFMTSILMPVFAKDSARRDQALAEVALLGTALDLNLYRQRHGGYPETIPFREMPRREDPFSGKPLRYRREGKGFVVYSVGENLKDDGGVAFPRHRDKGDIVWECRK